MRDVAIVAAGMTRFGELWDLSLRDILVEATSEALDVVKVDSLDSIIVGNMSAGQFVGQEHIGPLAADYLGMAGVAASRVESACASGGMALRAAFAEVASGMSDLVLAVGVGLWLSAMNVKYRDVVYLIPFGLQLWLFSSPVIYSSTFVPERFQAVYGVVNPMAGIIEGFRWAILGTEPPTYLLTASVAIVIVILLSGVVYFRRREKAFADVI